MTAPFSKSSSQTKKCNNHQSPPPTTNLKEDQVLDHLLGQLTAAELELAAKASYEYLMQPDPTKTWTFAKRFALRFLRSKDGDSTKALKRIKETLQFRSDMDIEGLCQAFHPDGNTDYAKHLEQEMHCKNVYVQGYDKEGRSTYIFIPRNVKRHDEEWTIKQHVYNLERAVAASQAPDQTVNAVVDFTGFSLRNAPPTQIGKEFMKTFRSHYAGAIHQIYLIDAPASFHCLWTIFKPLIGQKTRSKVHFIKSSSRKNDLEKYYEPNQAAKWMMSSGEKNRELDVHEYLHETPFDCAFDE